MYQGDIIRYNLSAYGFNIDVILEIVDVKPCNDRIVVKPVVGEWPLQMQHCNWREKETLSADYIEEYLYTIAPKSPPIKE